MISKMVNKKLEFKKNYRLRKVNNFYFEVTFPSDVVDRFVRRKKITLEEFLGQYKVVVYYGIRNVVTYTIAKRV